MRTRLLLKLLASATLFGTAFAMAASLGGIASDKIGADDAAVAPCDADGVTTAYTSGWDATDNRYEVTSVSVSNVSDTCDGQTLKVTVADSANSQLGEGTLAIPTSAATSHTVTLSTAASSEVAANVHVTIA